MVLGSESRTQGLLAGGVLSAHPLLEERKTKSCKDLGSFVFCFRGRMCRGMRQMSKARSLYDEGEGAFA
jgi:hypothetical protein